MIVFEKHLEELIRDFHHKMRISPEQEDATAPTLTGVGFQLKHMSQEMHRLFDESGNFSYMRFHLILEEAAELAFSMLVNDRRDMLDALCDLAYVTIGTATQYNLKFTKGFVEVHKSNMTKTPGKGPRLRDKGNTYVPPNFEGLF